MKRSHRFNVETDSEAMRDQSWTHAAAITRMDYYRPGPGSGDFSASGCIDAPEFMPAGACGAWGDRYGYSGMLVIPR